MLDWTSIAAALVIAPLTYAATNLDNLVLLAAVHTQVNSRHKLATGFTVASAVILGLSAAGSLVAYALPANVLGYVGVVPLAFGLRLLILSPEAHANALPARISAATIATLLIANSVDTVVAFAALFAESYPAVRVALGLGFALTAVTWLALVIRIAGRLRQLLDSSATVARLAPRIAGVIMVLVGAYILWDSGTDTL